MKKVLFIFLGMLAFVSCDDDNEVDTPQPEPTRTQMLTSKDWMMTASFQNQADQQRIDIFGNLPANVRDDIFKFSENGQAVREEGATREEGKPQIVDSGTWSFMNQEQELQVAFQNKPFEDQITEISDRKFVLRDVNGSVETITVFEAR